jgi:hypothetical protein
VWKKVLLIGAAALAGGCALAFYKRNTQNRVRTAPPINDAELDKMIEQSFPASDAPAYY